MDDKKFLPAIIFVMIIFSFGWYKFLYEPAQRETLSMELEARRLHEVEREILELKARHENLSAFVEAKELELDAARKFLPTTLTADKFIDELYRAADFYRVRITAVQVDEKSSAENFQSQVVSLNVETNYVSLLNFIREVLDGERLTRLENFSATSADNGIISCALSFEIFAAAP